MTQINGIDTIVEKLNGLVDPNKLEAAIGKACALVERVAKQKAPKDTGELRRQIASRVENDGNSVKGIVFNPLEYAPYVEYGTGLGAFEEGGSGNGRTDVPWAYRDEKTGELIFTSGQKPQPFLRPAMNENRENIRKIIKEGIKL